MRPTTLAAAVLLFGVQAQAGTITQTINFRISAHESQYEYFSQLDPSLAPLNAIGMAVDFRGGGTGPNYELYNTTNNAVSFYVTLVSQLSTLVGQTPYTYTVIPVTLGPAGSAYFTPTQIPPAGYQFSGLLPGADSFIGTRMLTVTLGGIEGVTASSPLVRVNQLQTGEIDGSETVTYYYGSSFPVPEPASLVILSLGLAVVAGLAWHRRRAA
jgi:hypothetical protein